MLPTIRRKFLGTNNFTLSRTLPQHWMRLASSSPAPLLAPLMAGWSPWRWLQRRVVALGIESGCGAQELAIARRMAMLAYRTAAEFAVRFDGGIDQCWTQSGSGPGAYLRACARAADHLGSQSRFLIEVNSVTSAGNA